VSRDRFLDAALTGAKLTGELIIDGHCHMGPWFNFPIADNKAEGMLRVMDRTGVRIACPSGHAGIGPDFRLGNDEVIAAMLRHPGRFLPYCSLNPNYGDEGCLDEYKRCERLGLRHIKLHNIHGKPYDHPTYCRALEYVNCRNCVVLAHTWNDASVTTLARLAKELPNLSFLLAHTGAGGYGEYVASASIAPNVYYDLTFSNAPHGLVEYLVGQVGEDRILFGSDLPFLSLTHQLGKVLCANVRPETKRKILGLNARSVFRMD
jgi:hypothetical protein